MVVPPLLAFPVWSESSCGGTSSWLRASCTRILHSACQSESARQRPGRSGLPAFISASMAAISRLQRSIGSRSIHAAAPARSNATSSKTRPSSCTACFSVYCSQRRTTTSTYFGSSSTSRACRPVLLTCDQRCARAPEDIQHRVPALAAVPNRAFNQFHRLLRRMQDVAPAACLQTTRRPDPARRTRSDPCPRAIHKGSVRTGVGSRNGRV